MSLVNTTLCYIKSGDDILFIHKTRQDLNEGKYLGVGGHFEENESPEECIRREIFEETGLKAASLEKLRLRGIVTFVSDIYDNEIMFVYDATLASRREEIIDSSLEGTLEFISIDRIYELPIWEGDKFIFDRLFGSEEFFTLKLVYEGDELVDVL